MPKTEKLIDSRTGSYENYNDALNLLIKNAKEELAHLNHQLLLITNTKKQTEESIIRLKNDWDIWKRQDKQKHDNLMSQKENDLISRFHALQKNEETFTRRSQELKEKELIYARLHEHRNEIDNQRVEVESLRVRASEALRSANAKISEGNSKLALAESNSAQISVIKNKYESLNIELVKRENDLKVKEEEFAKKTKNMEELQRIIEPKIKDIDLSKELIAKQKKELAEQESKINRKIDEDKSMLKALEEKDIKLKEREKTVEIKEEKIKRQLLALEVGKETVK